jgi:DNA-binding transcriptional LysR family regulator
VRTSIEGLGFERRVAVIAPSFTTAAMIAARTDDVAWLPTHAAALYARLLGLVPLRAPLPPLEIGCDLVWHERTHADPGARAFREIVTRTLREPAASVRRRRS